MDIPFNITKYENDWTEKQIDRFLELYPLFKDNWKEAIEFVDLYKMLVREKRIKWK
jgi:hypothetical protein